jgi:outer membrane biosynthesis protein TonB
VGAILVGALVIAWLNRWRKRQRDAGLSAGDQLAHFRQLYEQGELSPEEFGRIRGLLGERLRQEMQVPVPPAPAGPGGPSAAEPQAAGVADQVTAKAPPEQPAGTAEPEADIVVDPDPPPVEPPPPGGPTA